MIEINPKIKLIVRLQILYKLLKETTRKTPRIKKQKLKVNLWLRNIFYFWFNLGQKSLDLKTIVFISFLSWYSS